MQTLKSYRGFLYAISTGEKSQGVAIIYTNDREMLAITPTQTYKFESELHLAAERQIDQLCADENVPQPGDQVKFNNYHGVIESLINIGGEEKALVVIEPKEVFRSIHDGLPTIKAQEGKISLLIEPGTLKKEKEKSTADFFGINNSTRLNFKINVSCWQAVGLELEPRFTEKRV